MKINDLTVGQTVAVQFYGSKDSMKTIKYNGKYSFAAAKATVIEVGIHGDVYHTPRSYRPSKSATANYVVVERENGKHETVINTKVLADWDTYEAEQIEACDARIKRERTMEVARLDTDAELAAIMEKLGVADHSMPTVSNGYRGYDPATLASNKRKLVAVLKLALASSE